MEWRISLLRVIISCLFLDVLTHTVFVNLYFSLTYFENHFLNDRSLNDKNDFLMMKISPFVRRMERKDETKESRKQGNDREKKLTSEMINPREEWKERGKVTSVYRQSRSSYLLRLYREFNRDTVTETVPCRVCVGVVSPAEIKSGDFCVLWEFRTKFVDRIVTARRCPYHVQIVVRIIRTLAARRRPSQCEIAIETGA